MVMYWLKCYTILLVVLCVNGQMNSCYSLCAMEEVTCTCRPSSRFFNWRIITNDGSQVSMAFADSSNGTVQMRQRYSIQALVFYDGDNLPVSQLMITASPELHGATIECDQFSIIFNITDYISPTLKLSKGFENMHFNIKLEGSDRLVSLNTLNFSVGVASESQTATLTNLPAQLCFNHEELYSFQLRSIYCSTHGQSNIINLEMRCPFLIADLGHEFLEYTVNSYHTTALFVCGSDKNATFMCGTDGQWQGNDSCYSSMPVTDVSSFLKDGISTLKVPETEHLNSTPQALLLRALFGTAAACFVLIIILVVFICIILALIRLMRKNKQNQQTCNGIELTIPSVSKKEVWCQDNSAYDYVDARLEAKSCENQVDGVYEIMAPGKYEDNGGNGNCCYASVSEINDAYSRYETTY